MALYCRECGRKKRSEVGERCLPCQRRRKIPDKPLILKAAEVGLTPFQRWNHRRTHREEAQASSSDLRQWIDTILPEKLPR